MPFCKIFCALEGSRHFYTTLSDFNIRSQNIMPFSHITFNTRATSYLKTWKRGYSLQTWLYSNVLELSDTLIETSSSKRAHWSRFSHARFHLKIEPYQFSPNTVVFSLRWWLVSKIAAMSMQLCWLRLLSWGVWHHVHDFLGSYRHFCRILWDMRFSQQWLMTIYFVLECDNI
jgi:hypothetical protein